MVSVVVVVIKVSTYKGHNTVLLLKKRVYLQNVRGI